MKPVTYSTIQPEINILDINTQDRFSSLNSVIIHIMDFFSLGAIRGLSNCSFSEITDAMTAELLNSSTDSEPYNIPKTLSIELFGYTIKIKLKNTENTDGNVNIAVKKNGQKSEATSVTFNKNRYFKICTALVLRNKIQLPSISAVLETHDNELIGASLQEVDLSNMNLKNAHLNEANLTSSNLKGADFRRAKLAFSNLEWVNLTGAILENTDMEHANLTSANLTLADLKHSQLPHANLSLSNLTNANLENTFMLSANFNAANLENARLNNADMIYANFKYANLKNAYLINAKLTSSCFSMSDLSNAKLTQTELYSANLEQVILTDACLQEAYLDYANLKNGTLTRTNLTRASLNLAKLENANLNEANLMEANLYQACLRNADLTGANLNSTDFTNVNLSGANLNDAKLYHTTLTGANLSNTNLSGIQPTPDILHLPTTWDENLLDRYINHINNTESGNLLTMIDSISNKHADIKRCMVNQLIGSLNHSEIDLSSVALPLMDILSKDIYLTNKKISNWLNTLCSKYLKEYNDKIIQWNEGVFNQCIELFSTQPHLLLTYNSALMQIVALAIDNGSKPIKEKATELYQGYLQNKTIKPYCANSEFGNFSGLPDWETTEADNYILIADGSKNNVTAMLLSHSALNGMLNYNYSPQSNSWGRFYLYNGPENCLANREHPPLNKLFEDDFPIFNTPYKYAATKSNFILLLKSLNLGEMEMLFTSVLNAKSSVQKLVNINSQQTLGRLFSDKLTYSSQTQSYMITPEHYETIIGTYNLSSTNDTDKAKKLLSLTAVFIKYSSSALFGTEYESPETLRHYACALMEKAYSLDASIFRSHMPNWKNRLLGQNKTFSCSAVLFSIMVKFISEHFPDELASVLPPAWN